MDYLKFIFYVFRDTKTESLSKNYRFYLIYFSYNRNLIQ